MAQFQFKQRNRTKNGFTLVELVIVIIILGVLSVTAIPKLISKSAFEGYTVRDQLIARLRLVQLQGMNADPDANANNACYWVVVKDTCFYHDKTDRNSGVCDSPSSAANFCSSDSYDQYNRIEFPKNMLVPAQYRFEIKDGKLTADSTANTITLRGLTIDINSEGYIHAL